MIFLTADELARVARRVVGPTLVVADPGLLESAAARPQATFGGQEVYPTLIEKAAALTLSLVSNHPLVDGNKRLGLAGLLVFLGVNGSRLEATNDEAFDLIMAIATGEIRDVPGLAVRLAQFVTPA